jgi:hypothetical protein
VLFAELFMRAYPVLRVDTFAHPDANVGIWQSAMTYKFVGAIRGIGHLAGYQVKALIIGLAIGLVIAVARRLLAASRGYQRLIKASAGGFAFGWFIDTILFGSPYASSTGGFLNLEVALWFAAGSAVSSLLAWLAKAPKKADEPPDALPEDMSTTSLVGGGLIAGESLFALGAGLVSLLSQFL